MGNKHNRGVVKGETEDNKKSRDIDKAIAKEKPVLQKEIKFLLLGAGESGKSTLLKQMKLIYGEGFSQKDFDNSKEIIYMNVIKGMQALVEGAEGPLINMRVADENRKYVAVIKGLKGFDEKFTPEIAAAIKSLWADPAIRKAFEKRNLFQVYEHVSYFFDEIERVADPHFVATEEDILRTRMPTTGVAETMFELEKHRFRVVDVGGQRSERRKWMQCFPDVTVVVFVAAISEIDQELYEESGVNRFHEALNLFEETVNNDYFASTPIILFMNKEDILREKLQNGVDPKQCFPNYNGGCNYDLCTAHIKAEFSARNKNKNRDIFIRLTNATDRRNMKFVFDAVTSIILQAKLESIGLI